ncbi:MAG: DNA polymerase III subunit gamma/tau [Candidatus Omnitrophota bacterium]|jgi:DNA polymerase-3 subunit gamma/tau
MSYIVLARKYRPQAFSEIIGQSHITTTLANAISQGRVAHAYLFSGPRGIGKTTTARILAKALNCEKGPLAGPCNVCASCNEITQGTSLDILEIDGASNRGIDEIRNLRENIKFAPSKGKLKIYIIDEVHMLTQEAFNALLKTLEEPPAHVKFIFATTSPHKVPPTILSRCQRFDFRRISLKDIFDNLKKIAKAEKIGVSDEVLTLIAKYADGSMRDAEVILDQITSFSKGAIALEDVVRVLGIVGEDVLFGLSGAIRDKDAPGALKLIDTLVNDGKDMVQVIVGLIEHFRDLSIIKVSLGAVPLTDMGPEKIKRYEEEAQRFTVEEILYIINTLSNTIDFIRKSSLAKVPFEVAMIKLTRMGPIVSLSEIAEKVERLEKRSKQDVPPARASAPAAPTASQASPAPAVAPASADKAHAASPASDRADLDELLSSWSRIVALIQTRKMSAAQYLQRGFPVSFESGTISIGFTKADNFHKEALDSAEFKQLIEDAVREILKVNVKIKFTISDAVNKPDSVVKEYPADDVSGPGAEERPSFNSSEDVDPIIKNALEMFGGELKEPERGASR